VEVGKSQRALHRTRINFLGSSNREAGKSKVTSSKKKGIDPILSAIGLEKAYVGKEGHFTGLMESTLCTQKDSEGGD